MVKAEAVPLVGGRTFWVYSGDLDAGAFNAVFEPLDSRFDPAGDRPVGIAVYVDDPGLVRARPEAVWPDTELVYAGVAPDGRQVRIRYFGDARIGRALPNAPTQADWYEQDHALAPGYRIVPMAETDAVGPEDVLELWARERAVRAEAAQRRVHQVSMVGLDPSDGLASVSTVYLQRNRQLGLDLWYYRTYVAEPHRMGNMAIRLLWATRDHLRDRYVAGEADHAPGMIMEVENEFLKAYYPTGYWVLSDFWFIGDSELGAHVRVHYFPGAQVPPPADAPGAT